MTEAIKTTNAERMQQLYKAFDTGDIETVLSGMHPDIVWNEAENFIYADGNPYIGPEKILNGVFMRLGTEWDNFTLTNREFYAAEGGSVLVTGRYEGRYKGSGKDLNAQFAHFWKLKDGKVVSFQQYTDTKQAAEVATL